MGHYGFRILLHFLFIITFILVSFCCTHILVRDVSLNAAKYFNSIHGFKDLHYMVKNGDGNESPIGKMKIYGGKQILIVEKFRTLLGLSRFSPRNGDFAYFEVSPSPSPSPSIAPEAPAPSPVPRVHRHPHPHSHHYPFIPAVHRVREKRRGRSTRVLTAVLVSVGISTALCAIALFWGCKKFKKQRKKSTRSVSLFSSEAGSVCRSRYGSSQNSVKKVTSDPGPDLFYLDSLDVALESSESICLNKSSVIEKIDSNEDIANNTLSEKDEQEQEISVSMPDDDNCSGVGEIVCVYKNADSMKCDINDCNSSSGDKIVPEEVHSSDDEELFHSLCNSRSSSNRLSNVSAGSLIDTSETMPQDELKTLTCSVSSSTHLSTPPPPPLPPPPPPLPPLPTFPTQSPCRPTVSSVKMKSKVLSHASLQIESSSRNSDSSLENDLLQSPPNQAKPAVGIPPPPCPPPFASGSTSLSKGPPPPPSLPFQQLALGKDGSPLPKLKPLHWDKVRAAPDRSTVWDKIRPSSFEFDEEMIESLFGYNLHNSMKIDEGKSKTPSPSKHVLEPKRLQNISILSKALGVTVEQVCEALIKGNGLFLPQLEALAKMVPTKEEEDKLSSYKGDINELGSAEKFVMAMLKVPFAFLRIEAMLYRETFDDEVHLLKKSFSMLEEACKELRSSRLFLKLLEAVLKTGNRMNIGTIRGGARAFKLDALLKLSDVKGTDGKTTLLHFVVQEIIRSEGLKVSQSIMGKIDGRRKIKTIADREEDYKRMGLDLVSGLGIELCNVKKTATMDLDVIATSVSDLSEEMNKIKALVINDLSEVENNDNFVHSMTTFLNYAERNLKELQEDENRVLLRVKEVTEYFHGNVSKDESNPLRIFVIVRDFLNMLDHVCKELRSSKTPNSPNPLAPFR